jgi:hypothetical protein
VRHLDHAGRELGAQLDRGRDVARFGQRDDLLLDGGADAGQLGGAVLTGQRQYGRGRLTDRLGRVAVGVRAVDGGAVELGQIAQLVQGGGDLGVRGLGLPSYVTYRSGGT